MIKVYGADENDELSDGDVWKFRSTADIIPFLPAPLSVLPPA